jgi:hypothetical protein
LDLERHARARVPATDTQVKSLFGGSGWTALVTRTPHGMALQAALALGTTGDRIARA